MPSTKMSSHRMVKASGVMMSASIAKPSYEESVIIKKNLMLAGSRLAASKSGARVQNLGLLHLYKYRNRAILIHLDSGRGEKVLSLSFSHFVLGLLDPYECHHLKCSYPDLNYPIELGIHW